jgi:hypothetical protein
VRLLQEAVHRLDQPPVPDKEIGTVSEMEGSAVVQVDPLMVLLDEAEDERDQVLTAWPVPEPGREFIAAHDRVS